MIETRLKGTTSILKLGDFKKSKASRKLSRKLSRKSEEWIKVWILLENGSQELIQRLWYMCIYRDFQCELLKCLAPLCLGWSVEFSNLWEIYELHPDVFCPIKRSSVTSMRITWRSIRPNVKKRSLDSTKLCLVFWNSRSNKCLFFCFQLVGYLSFDEMKSLVLIRKLENMFRNFDKDKK